MKYAVYILKCNDGSYYTGVTNYLYRRMQEHNDGINQTSYTYKRRPLELVHYEYYEYIEDAIMREKQIRKWSRKKKEALINNDEKTLKQLAKNYTQNPSNRNANYMKTDSILVIKHQRLLHLKCEDKIIKTYSIALGQEPMGAKEFEGDNKTPEGEYTIYQKTEQSEFYKSLGISYPNVKEIVHAEKQGKKAGGQIRIHGFKNDFIGDQVEGKKKDWTTGCIAVTNIEMDEIFELVEVGISIIIRP